MGRFRRVIPYCLIAGVILCCVAYAFTDHGQDVQDAASSSLPVYPAADLEYISNLGSEKYNHLLDIWREDGPYSSTQDIAYPSFYGGCYEDDNKDFVIMVTSLDQEVIDYFENLIDLNYVRFSLVENSYQELNRLWLSSCCLPVLLARTSPSYSLEQVFHSRKTR